MVMQFLFFVWPDNTDKYSEFLDYKFQDGKNTADANMI